MPTLIVVDANVMLSALLGGHAARLIVHPAVQFVTTERTTWEVKKYIPCVAAKLRLDEADILEAFEAMPIVAYQPAVYDRCLPEAQRLIGARDPKDVDILALAFALDAPLWSSDRDFEGISNLTLLKNDAVQSLLEASQTEEVVDNNP